MNQTWHARVTYATATPIGEDALFDVMEALAEYGASASVTPDYRGGSVSITLDDPESAIHAAEAASGLVSDALAIHVGDADITGIDVLTDDEFDEQLARPLFPEVVGYAEIARMAGVSRQRARKFAEQESFPRPVIETTQGPLMTKSAVRSWLQQRNARLGRRAAAV